MQRHSWVLNVSNNSEYQVFGTAVRHFDSQSLLTVILWKFSASQNRFIYKTHFFLLLCFKERWIIVANGNKMRIYHELKSNKQIDETTKVIRKSRDRLRNGEIKCSIWITKQNVPASIALLASAVFFSVSRVCCATLLSVRDTCDKIK